MKIHIFLSIQIATLLPDRAFGCFDEEKHNAFTEIDINKDNYLEVDELIEVMGLENGDAALVYFDLNNDERASCQGRIFTKIKKRI